MENENLKSESWKSLKSERLPARVGEACASAEVSWQRLCLSAGLHFLWSEKCKKPIIIWSTVMICENKKQRKYWLKILLDIVCLIASTPCLRKSIMRIPNNDDEQSPIVCERWAITTKMKKARDLWHFLRPPLPPAHRICKIQLLWSRSYKSETFPSNKQCCNSSRKSSAKLFTFKNFRLN